MFCPFWSGDAEGTLAMSPSVAMALYERIGQNLRKLRNVTAFAQEQGGAEHQA